MSGTQVRPNVVCEVKRRTSQQRIKDPISQQKSTKDQSPLAMPKIFPIGNGKHVKVCLYRRKLYVNIRDYTVNVKGQLYATKRGILLSPEEWEQFKSIINDVDQELLKTN